MRKVPIIGCCLIADLNCFSASLRPIFIFVPVYFQRGLNQTRASGNVGVYIGHMIIVAFDCLFVAWVAFKSYVSFGVTVLSL